LHTYLIDDLLLHQLHLDLGPARLYFPPLCSTLIDFVRTRINQRTRRLLHEFSFNHRPWPWHGRQAGPAV
jgi:hypothetical protein